MTRPFLIHKDIQVLIGEPKAIKKLRSLFVEMDNNKQEATLKKCSPFEKHPFSC